MPFALIFIGLVLVVTGARDTYKPMGAQLVTDFTGKNNFTYWLAAIGAVGAVGYYTPAKSFSHAFLLLILLAMVLANGGVFDKFTQALAQGPAASPAPDPVAAASPSGGNSGAKTAGTDGINASQIAATALEVAPYLLV